MPGVKPQKPSSIRPYPARGGPCTVPGDSTPCRILARFAARAVERGSSPSGGGRAVAIPPGQSASAWKQILLCRETDSPACAPDRMIWNARSVRTLAWQLVSVSGEPWPMRGRLSTTSRYKGFSDGEERALRGFPLAHAPRLPALGPARPSGVEQPLLARIIRGGSGFGVADVA